MAHENCNNLSNLIYVPSWYNSVGKWNLDEIWQVMMHALADYAIVPILASGGLNVLFWCRISTSLVWIAWGDIPKTIGLLLTSLTVVTSIWIFKIHWCIHGFLLSDLRFSRKESVVLRYRSNLFCIVKIMSGSLRCLTWSRTLANRFCLMPHWQLIIWFDQEQIWLQFSCIQ